LLNQYNDIKDISYHEKEVVQKILKKAKLEEGEDELDMIPDNIIT